MITLILVKVPSQGQVEKTIKSLALDPNFSNMTVYNVDGHNYEVREINEENGEKTYRMSDSGIPQS